MKTSKFLMHVGLEGNWWVVNLQQDGEQVEVMRIHRKFLPGGMEGQKMVGDFTRECIVAWVRRNCGMEVEATTEVIPDELLDEKRKC